MTSGTRESFRAMNNDLVDFDADQTLHQEMTSLRESGSINGEVSHVSRTESDEVPQPGFSINFSGVPDADELEDYDFAEEDPLISYQNYNNHLSRTMSTDTYTEDNHCHEAKPIHSSKRARRKLTIASVVCLIFVIAEVIGK